MRIDKRAQGSFFKLLPQYLTISIGCAVNGPKDTGGMDGLLLVHAT